MPSIVGVINIVSVDHSSIINFADAVTLAPKSTSQTFAGAGSFNTADNMKFSSGPSETNTNEIHFSDGNIAGIV
ncbi:spore germination protein [Aneurinibacillus danicus]|jgi:spore germination protein PA|uniref:Putative spore germination protein GerPA n=1 Tax=Aneurinibacillus danicus TaxID=267746 RepID=A0A511VAW5_9BACL|nr:spore germination protein [Aneurinibacillus danicus]GEN35461.1 putative spore germination protein GerPA [Aneurinibacillus danicus]